MTPRAGRGSRQARRAPAPVVLHAGLVCALFTLLTTLITVLPAPAAQAAAGKIDLSLTKVSAAAITPGSSIVVSGLVRNSGNAPLTNLRVQLRLDWKALDTEGLQAWAGRKATDAAGVVWDGSLERIGGALQPGQSVPFALVGAADVLQLPRSVDGFGPRGMAVEALGGSGEAQQVALQRTFVVWDPGQAKSTTRLSVLVPITASPDAASTDAGAPSPALAQEWTDGGRLSRVVEAATADGVSWAIDPALLTAAVRAANPQGNGTSASPSAGPSAGSSSAAPTAGASAGTPGAAGTAPATSGATASPDAGAASSSASGRASAPDPAGPDAAAAKAWLTKVTAATTGHDTFALPWGDPDLAALAHADAAALLSTAQDDAAATTRAVLGTPLDVTLALPVDGLADQDTLRLLGRATGRTVVLADTVTSPATVNTISGGHVALPGVRRDVTALVSDTRLSQQVEQLAGTSPTLATQRVLAETAALSAATASAAVTGTRGGALAQATAVRSATRSVLATMPRGWDPRPGAMQESMTLLSSAPWLSLQGVSTARQEPLEAGPRAIAPLSAQARAAELPVSHVSEVAGAYDDLLSFSPALGSPLAIVPAQRRAALSLVGTGWRSPSVSTEQRDQALQDARKGLVGTVSGLYNGISVSSSSVNLLGSGDLPVTVTSTLNQPVTLVLSLRPASGRLRVAQDVTVTLQAATDPKTPALATVRVPVEPVANGDVTVEARLYAPNGSEPLRTWPQPLTIHIRLDWEDRGLVVGGFVLLFLLVWGLIRSVRRGRKRLPPESSPDPDDIGQVVAPDPVEAATPDDAASPDAERLADTDSIPIIGSRVLVPEAAVAVGAGARTSASVPGSSATMSPGSTGVAPSAFAAVRPSDGDGNGPGDNGSGDNGSGGNGSTGDGPGADAGSGPGGRADDASLMRNSALMTAGTLVSRVLGLVRIVVLTAAIGARLSNDAFTTANTLPNNLFILIGGGVLNAVLVPQIVRAAKRDDGGRDYTDRLLTLAIVILGGATIVVTALAPLLIRLFSKGWDDDTLALGTAFALWCLPQVFFYGLYTIYGQVLNARGSFGPYMWAPVVNNVVAIAGMVVFMWWSGSGVRPVTAWTAADVALFAGTATLGVVAQALVLVPAMRRSGYTWRPRWGWRGVGLRTAGTVAGWTFAGVALSQAAFVVTSQLATAAGAELERTRGPAGGRAVYDTAFLIFMLPHSLVAVSLVTAVFTRMSAAAGQGRVDDVRADLSLTVRTVGVATVLSTVAFAALGSDLVFALFGGTGRETTDRFALVAGALLIGLVPFSALYLFQRVCYAYEDARSPFWVGVLTTAVWTAGNLAVAALLPARWVVIGIGLAMSLSSVVGVLAMIPVLRRRLGSLDGARIVRTHVRLGVAALAAGAVAWLADRAVHTLLGEGRTATYAALAAGGALLLLTYSLVLRALRVTELDDLVRPVLERLRPRG